MQFFSRKLVKPQNLNPMGTLFGGHLLSWIDEDAAIFVMSRMGNKNVVTKFVSEINFVNSAKNGDIIEIGLEVVDVGTTSVTLKCIVRNIITQEEIIKIEKIVFVHIDSHGKPVAHDLTQV